jgi:UDP-N-acetylmuramate-alanine ligase
VHFVGIGGIGMSGIAEIMLRVGYTVQGSDAKASANTERLEKPWAQRSSSARTPANVEGASAVVYSTAVKADNPEMVAGRAARLPLVRRAEMLAELMRLKFSIAVGGTHGKTTTTSMVAALLDAGGLDPTVVNGGIINAYGTNAKVGEGDWIVVEADESDGTFLKLKSTVAIVTNIDAEHLDHWGDFDAVKRASATSSRTSRSTASRRSAPTTRGAGPGGPRREPPPDRLRRKPPGRGPRHRSSTWAPTARPSRSLSRGGTARRRPSSGCTCPCLAATTCSNALAAIAVARELGVDEASHPRRAWPPSAGSSAASPPPAWSAACGSSTTTATTRSRSPPC